MSREFLKPPRIVRSKGYAGLSAEGDASGADLETFEYAVQSYGFLVAPGTSLTGGQWLHQIARQYDCREPRHAAVTAAIARAMKCGEFADDYLVINGDDVGLFRGTAAAAQQFLDRGQSGEAGGWSLQPVSACSALQVAQAELANAKRDAHALGARLLPVDGAELAAPHFYAVGGSKVIPGAPGDLMDRMLCLLDHSPVGKESFSAAENEDFEAQCELAAKLMEHAGYGMLVTSSPVDGARPSNASPRAPAELPLGADEFAETLGKFASGLSQQGWAPDKAVFLCRPTALVGVLLPGAAFESIVHPMLVGFRLPQAMVEQAMQLHQERSAMYLRQAS